jgi:hypothetical protein
MRIKTMLGELSIPADFSTSGQEHEAAVPEQVVPRPERRQGGVAGSFGRDPVPAQAGQVAVLPGVEQDQAVAVLDEVRIDGPRRGPAPGGQQPHGDRAPASGFVIGMDLHLARAHHGHPADRVGCVPQGPGA